MCIRDSPWGVYPNVGKSMPTKEVIIEQKLSIKEFSNEINNYINSGAKVVGACCGSDPDYIKAARKAIDLAAENWPFESGIHNFCLIH